uniref:Uncharacterized protein n=1 Tax=Arundo donax TaxID=35708 RepID=A0A0A9EGL6_ARUDO
MSMMPPSVQVLLPSMFFFRPALIVITVTLIT